MSKLVFNPTRVDDDPEYALGEVGWDNKGKAYMYVKAALAIEKYRMCRIQETFDASETTTAADRGEQYGVSQADIPIGKYGWVQRLGACTLRVAASCAAHAVLYTTSVAGTLDDSSTSQEKIWGVHLTTARGTGAGFAPAMLNWPVHLGY